ncbi:MAG: FAD-dependent oxidoreductase [Anaerolineales bacterium]|nr:FAD-dependent oxidoreductase [Anaerolineales bacterium]
MKAAIIGGGIAGLSAAYDLARAGAEVVIFEAADYVGGLSAGFKIPRWDWSVEHYYHHWFATDDHVLGLIDELGLSHKVLFPRPVTAVFYEERFYALDSPLAVLRYPGLPFLHRLWMGVVVAYLKYIARWRPLEKVTADSWIRRWMGDRAYQQLWKPLLVSKFGQHYHEVNMAWMWARFKARTPRLGTFEGGFQAFLDAFADRVRAMGVEMRLRTRVNHVERRPTGGLRVSIEDGDVEVDQCLATISPAVLAKIAPSLPVEYTNRLLGMKSMGAVVMILALRQRLSEGGIYWHNLPKEAGFPFLSLVEHTNFISPAFFGGDHIVYCGDYLDPDHEYFSMQKEALLERFLPSFVRFNPNFKRDWVRDSWLFRTPYAQPVPPVNHSEVIPSIKTPITGLWLASMSQVYPWDRGTNFAVEIARRTVREMLLEEQS